MQAIHPHFFRLCSLVAQETPVEGTHDAPETLHQQLQPPQTNQAVAAELVASGLHRALAGGGRAAQFDGPAAEELVSSCHPGV